jgi:hypothetical protein
MSRNRAMSLWGVYGTPELPWALIGSLRARPEIEAVLGERAKDALNALAIEIYRHQFHDEEFDLGLIGRAADQVNRCSYCWPRHGCRDYAEMGLVDLDRPAAWGVQWVRDDLEAQFAEIVRGEDREVTLSQVGDARAAADAVIDLLKENIGSPYSLAPPTVGTARRQAAWKRFNTTLASLGPLQFLPILDLYRARGAPLGSVWWE